MSDPVWTQNHMHSEPVCADPDCRTYLPAGSRKLTTTETPVCIGCNRTPEEIYEYSAEATGCGTLTPSQYVRTNEGTFNPVNGHFACTECYIRMGQPTSPYGWKAP